MLSKSNVRDYSLKCVDDSAVINHSKISLLQQIGAWLVWFLKKSLMED